MPEIPAPTPEDLKRDAAADLAVCEERESLIAAAAPPPRSDYPGQPGWREQAALGKIENRFNLLARTALPAWIRRCDLAEQVARSRKELLDTACAIIAELKAENARLREK